jgi:hypothetical protein
MTGSPSPPRAALCALAALLLLAMALFWPLWSGQSHLVPFHVLAGDPALEGLDLAADRPDWRFFDSSPITMFYAEKSLAARELRRGELPLWNPYNGLGAPLLADAQSQPFAPFFAPFALSPSPWTYSVCLVLQLIFGGAGMALLLRNMKWGVLSSCFGTLIFAFNPYVLNYLVYSDTWAYVWFPWLFLAADRAAERPGRWWLLSLAAAGAGASGHIEVAFLGAACAAVYGLIRSLVLRRRVQALAQGVAATLMAAVLSAWWVFPFIEWVRHSGSSRFAHNTPYPYHPSALFIAGSELLLPSVLLALTVFGAASKELAVHRLALLPAGVWAVVMMFPCPVSLQRLATFDFVSGRYGRSMLWFLVALLASAGVQALVGKGAAAWARWLALAVGGAWWGSLFVMRAPSLAAASSNHWVPLVGETIRPWGWIGLISILGLAVFLIPERFLSRGISAAVLGCLTLLSVAGQHAAFDLYWNRSEPTLAGAVADAADVDPGRLWFPERDLWRSLPPNLSAAFAIRDIRYCSPLYPSRLAQLNPDPHPNKDLFQSWDLIRMKFLGVNTVLMAKEQGGMAAVTSTPILGRARWISRAVPAPDPLAATREALKDGAWAQTLYLDGGGTPSTGASGERPAGAKVDCVEDGATRSEWFVSAPADGWLLLRDLYWPGWRASVDGRGVDIVAADGVFRAVPLPAGSHTVRFRYLPGSFLWGVALTALGLLTLGILGLRGVGSRAGRRG